MLRYTHTRYELIKLVWNTEIILLSYICLFCVRRENREKAAVCM